MRRFLLLLLALGLTASVALAGEVFGTITDAGKPVPVGTKVEVTAQGKTYTGETDKFGTYHVFVKEKGKCSLALLYKDQKPSVEVFSYEKATRYDWTLETADGKLALKRK